MGKRLFIGSLPYSTTDSQLEELFAGAGKVESAKVIIDKFSGRGKGFGFVEMASDEEAQNAIKMFNGYSLEGRSIVVNIARPREDRGSNNFGDRRNFKQKRW